MGFLGLHTSLSGLRASQAGLDTVSHNIANANTDGYTRQRVDLTARTPYSSPMGPVGTGVDVTSIGRLRDAFLDARARNTAASTAHASTRAELLGRMEATLAEPTGGISNSLASLWNSFEDLATRPDDVGTRRGVVSALADVAGTIRSVASSWDQLTSDVALRRETVVTAVNADLQQVAELNRRVANLPAERVGADLLDQRDALIDRIAQATGAQATARPDGTVSLTLAGQPLVTGGTHASLALAGDSITLVDGSTEPATTTDVTSGVGGELGALQRFLATDAPAVRGQLDDLARVLGGAVNTQHAAGATPDGEPGAPLFAWDPADPAGSITAALTDPAALAPGQVGDDGSPPGPHDGRNAVALAGFRTLAVSDATVDGPDAPGATIGTRLAELVVTLAGDVRSSRLEADAQRGLEVAARTARQSAHGVSLDEEMVGLVTYQRSLEAASRVMSAIDQALDTLVNRTGVVGR